MSKEQGQEILTWGDAGQKGRRDHLLELFRKWPVRESEFFLNLGLFLTPQTVGRVLFMDHLYRQVLPVQGVVMELGCRWGQNLSLFTSLRGIHEPYNRLRKVIGFDTFEGFPSITDNDAELRTGMYGTAPGYKDFLAEVLEIQEQESALSHLKKHEIVAGDASVTVPEYLKRNPHTIVALAYFDMDIYRPTKDCLKAILPHLTRGSVIGFDEVNDPVTPGETTALKEVFGLGRYSIRRFAASARTSYLVIDEPIVIQD